MTGAVRASAITAVSAGAATEEERAGQRDQESQEGEVDARELSGLFHGGREFCRGFIVSAIPSPIRCYGIAQPGATSLMGIRCRKVHASYYVVGGKIPRKNLGRNLKKSNSLRGP